MMIGRDVIAGMIPHDGAMCLLDGVLNWDQVSIRCVSTRHRAEDNPLRRAGHLSAICGVEFAAQAMAVHGRLAGTVGRRPKVGYIASLRDVKYRHEHLDLLEADLVIGAELLMGDEQRVIYRFALDCAGIEILSGRAAVVLEAAPE